MLIPKSKRMCIPKRLQLEPDPEVWKFFIRALDDFRGRRKYVRFIKVKPFLDYLSTSKKKKDFIDFSNELEHIRCENLGIGKTTFYRLASEFILIPNGTAYYKLSILFGCNGNWEADEFRHRLVETMFLISYAVGCLDGDESEKVRVMELIQSINEMRLVIDVSSGSMYRSKDWYCMVAIRNELMLRGWTVEEALRRMRVYYRRNIKKVYPERILKDLAEGGLDGLGDGKTKAKPVKKRGDIAAIESQKWYPQWFKDLGEKVVK